MIDREVRVENNKKDNNRERIEKLQMCTDASLKARDLSVR